MGQNLRQYYYRGSGNRTYTTVIPWDGDRQHGNATGMGTMHFPEKLNGLNCPKVTILILHAVFVISSVCWLTSLACTNAETALQFGTAASCQQRCHAAYAMMQVNQLRSGLQIWWQPELSHFQKSRSQIISFNIGWQQIQSHVMMCTAEPQWPNVMNEWRFNG